MHNTLIELALHSLNEQNLITELSQSKHLIEEKARLEERERISSTIHNHAGHTITTSIVALDAADLLLDIDKEKAREKYQIAHKRMQESLNSIRVAIRLLTKENEPTSLSDFVYTASQSIDEFVTTTAIKVRHNLNEEQLKQEDCLLPPTYIEYLNGVILESFSNGIRHGSATTFIVLLEKSDTMLSLTIEDNGTGMNQYTREEIHDKLTHGYGLKRVDSFARKYGGNTIYSYKEGFSVKISLPLTPLTISPKTYTLQEDNYDAD